MMLLHASLQACVIVKNRMVCFRAGLYTGTLLIVILYISPVLLRSNRVGRARALRPAHGYRTVDYATRYGRIFGFCQMDTG